MYFLIIEHNFYFGKGLDANHSWLEFQRPPGVNTPAQCASSCGASQVWSQVDRSMFVLRDAAFDC